VVGWYLIRLNHGEQGAQMSAFLQTTTEKMSKEQKWQVQATCICWPGNYHDTTHLSSVMYSGNGNFRSESSTLCFVLCNGEVRSDWNSRLAWKRFFFGDCQSDNDLSGWTFDLPRVLANFSSVYPCTVLPSVDDKNVRNCKILLLVYRGNIIILLKL
jgi:hypothetical protein